MVERKKTATASVQVFYGIEQEDLPKVGGYNIILDSQNNPLGSVAKFKNQIQGL